MLARYTGRRIAVPTLRGDAVDCPCCARSFKRFLWFNGRENARCPACGSVERHRLLLLYLKAHNPLLVELTNGRVAPVARALHFSPFGGEATIGEWLEQRTDYTSTDLEGGMVPADIQHLPFDNNSFDLIVCAHVLEHVQDDREALRELERVLRPGGSALVMVPITGGTTLEDPTITTPEGRLRAFGQVDHVRSPGRDYWHRFIECGFAVERVSGDTLGDATRERYALGDDEIYVCRATPTR